MISRDMMNGALDMTYLVSQPLVPVKKTIGNSKAKGT
jgi:hypothetical protein